MEEAYICQALGMTWRQLQREPPAIIMLRLRLRNVLGSAGAGDD